MLVQNSTITANNAYQGAGVAFWTNPVGLRIDIGHSIIAGNNGFDLSYAATSTSNGYRSNGYNVIGTAHSGIPSFLPTNSFDQPGDQVIGTVSPLLGPLADNGGPTQTHALLPGSPALDAGDPNFDPNDPDGDPLITDDAMLYDQRGAPFQRVVQGLNLGLPLPRIDIGAYEAQGPPLADFDSDLGVDGADFLAWQRGFGTASASQSDGDSDHDNDVDASDLAAWQVSYGDTIVLPPFSATRTDTPSEPTTNISATTTALIDAAIAFAAQASTTPELPTPTQESITPEPTSSTTAAIDTALEQANPTSNIRPTSSSKPIEAADNEQWLTDQLLEKVFG